MKSNVLAAVDHPTLLKPREAFLRQMAESECLICRWNNMEVAAISSQRIQLPSTNEKDKFLLVPPRHSPLTMQLIDRLSATPRLERLRRLKKGCTPCRNDLSTVLY